MLSNLHVAFSRDQVGAWPCSLRRLEHWVPGLEDPWSGCCVGLSGRVYSAPACVPLILLPLRCVLGRTLSYALAW